MHHRGTAHNAPQSSRHDSQFVLGWFFPHIIQFLSRDTGCVSSFASALQPLHKCLLTGRIPAPLNAAGFPPAPRSQPLEPAEIPSPCTTERCLTLDTEGSPCIPDRSTARCCQKPQEEQVGKTPFRSVTIIPGKTGITQKHPEKSAYVQHEKGGFLSKPTLGTI